MEFFHRDLLERVFDFLDHPPKYATVCRSFYQVSLSPSVNANSYFNEYGIHGLWQIAKRHLPFLTYDIYKRLLGRGVQNDVWFYQIYVHEIVTSQNHKNYLNQKSLSWSDIGTILHEGLLKYGIRKLNRECLISLQLLQPLRRIEASGIDKTIDLLAHYRILPTYKSLSLLYSPCISSRLGRFQAIGRYMIHLIVHESCVVEHMIKHQVYLDELDPYIAYALLTNYNGLQECYGILIKLRKIGLCKELSEETLLNVLLWFLNHDGLALILEFIEENWPESLVMVDLPDLARQAIQEIFASTDGLWFPSSMDLLLSKIPESRRLFEDMMKDMCRQRRMKLVSSVTEHDFLGKFDDILKEKSPDAEMVSFFVSLALWWDRSLPITQFFSITDLKVLQSFAHSMIEFLSGVLPTKFQVEYVTSERNRIRWISRILELWKADMLSVNTVLMYACSIDKASAMPYLPSTPFHRQLLIILKSSYSSELIAKFESGLSPLMINAWKEATWVSLG